MDSIQLEQEKLIKAFEPFDEWMDKYTLLISYAKELEAMPEGLKTEENRILGCQSNLWIFLNQRDNRIFICADSDVLIVKGIAALIIRILSGRTAKEINDSKIFLFQHIGLEEHLAKTRSNGLSAMIEQIRIYSARIALEESGQESI